MAQTVHLRANVHMRANAVCLLSVYTVLPECEVPSNESSAIWLGLSRWSYTLKNEP